MLNALSIVAAILFIALIGARPQGRVESTDKSVKIRVDGEGRQIATFTRDKTIMPLDTSYFKKSDTPACKGYAPNYAMYHTIVHIEDTSRLEVTVDKEKTSIGYIVIASGTDQVSGQDRRVAVELIPFTGRMKQLAGTPGTRITFGGTPSNPFSPLPELKLWNGAIDIDPKCGLMISANQEMQIDERQKKDRSAPTDRPKKKVSPKRKPNNKNGFVA